MSSELLKLRSILKCSLESIDAMLSAPATDDSQEKFEEWRKDDIIRRLTERLSTPRTNTKNISIHTVCEWARLDENIIRKTLKPRNPIRTSTYWAVDVLEYLCKMWGRELPPIYYQVCEKELITTI